MNKRLFFLLGIFILIIVLFSLIKVNTNPKKITGESTAQNVAINITLTGPPELTLISPRNDTYFNNNSLLLNFTSRYASSIVYNIDDSANTTIASSTYFNTTSGNHTLYLYANNSYGLTAKNVSFFVNLSKFTIYYEEFAGSNSGISNNFNISSYEDIQNLSNIILENTNYGKILFNQAINVTNDLNNNDNQVNLSYGVKISDNRIEINSTELPNFNKPATLTLYNLNFTNPRILKDGEVCSSSICTQQSYSGGALIFNVTGFSVYSAEEAPASSGTGKITSGGGSSSPATPSIFSLDKKEIKVSLKQGQIKSEIIKVKNARNEETKIKISAQKIEEITIINEKEFTLKPGEEKEITIDFIAKESTIPSLYVGKIIVESGGEKEEILTAVEVESDSALFDVEIKVPTQFSIVSPGDEILLNVRIFEVADVHKKVDVDIEYRIVSIYGDIITSATESLAVDGQINYVKLIKLPKNMDGGQYIIYVKVDYEGKSASSSFSIIVKTEKESGVKGSSLLYLMLILIGSIVLVLLIIAVILRRGQKKIREDISSYKKKVDERSENIEEERKKIIEKDKNVKKIKNKLEALERAYLGKYISKDSYEKAKKGLKKTLNE
ncbi:hypothetical protein HY212_03210 [Candidatus Pacearchaeota archaeon]|nr:hypothetical protein [Candidatus Pacearchaeota archaeon]